MTETPAKGSRPTASHFIDRYIASIGDWRGDRLAQIRRLFLEADPDMTEEWKWMGTPTWSHDGVVAVAGPFKGKVKVTFSRGAHLPDPHHLFNNGLGGKEWRALDLVETATLDETAFKDLVRAAVSFNRAELSAQANPRRATAAPRRIPRKSK
jgi:hypothetical protein